MYMYELGMHLCVWVRAARGDDRFVEYVEFPRLVYVWVPLDLYALPLDLYALPLCIYSGHLRLHVARSPRLCRLLQQLRSSAVLPFIFHVLPLYALLLHVLPAYRLFRLEIPLLVRLEVPLLVRMMAQQPRAIQPRLQDRSAHVQSSWRTLWSRSPSTKLSMSWLRC